VLLKHLKKYLLLIYILFFFISLLPLLISEINTRNDFNSNSELFKIELTRFKNINDLTAHIDGIYSVQHSLDKIDTSAYVNICSEIVKRRFFHGQSNYSINENWIACLSGKLIWAHLSAIVDPDDIMNYNEALCSQQAIVFMEILKRKGITTRWVGWGRKEGPGHFLTEVFYNNDWHLYDVNKEPNWQKIKIRHNSMSYYLNNKDSLSIIYDGLINKTTLSQFLNQVRYGQPNEFPAKKMLLFHRTTKLITYLLPIFFATLIIRQVLKNYKRKRSIPNSSSKIISTKRNDLSAESVF
jgi:hypothetical protein